MQKCPANLSDYGREEDITLSLSLSLSLTLPLSLFLYLFLSFCFFFSLSISLSFPLSLLLYLRSSPYSFLITICLLLSSFRISSCFYSHPPLQAFNSHFDFFEDISLNSPSITLLAAPFLQTLRLFSLSLSLSLHLFFSPLLFIFSLILFISVSISCFLTLSLYVVGPSEDGVAMFLREAIHCPLTKKKQFLYKPMESSLFLN